jgi:methylmalonyl-CoA mutase
MSQNQMFSEFKKLSKNDWLNKAEKDLRGKPLDDLSSNWYGLKIDPYYSIEDINSNKTTPIIAIKTGWINYVEIEVEGEIEANAIALKHLNLGATGILFKLKNSVDYSILLDEIDPGHCAISFTSKTDSGAYLQYILTNYPEAIISGFIDDQVVNSNRTADDFYTTILKGDSEDEVIELTEILFNCYQLLDTITEDAAEIVISNIAYEVKMSTNYFFGIAKIRALRILLHRFFSAYKLNIGADIFHIIACSKAWVKSDYEPHENMLKATTSAMAAISGGCNSLIINPGYEDDQEELVARNISSVLEFESYLGKVADPAAGSYFIENLTKDIISKSWSEFKSRVK